MPATKAHLLLVDDDPDLLKLLAIRLKACGYRVTTAESAERALALLAAVRPDLVVTDLRMAGIDGMGLFREIEASHSGLPVIILTAHGTIPEAVAATRQGVFGFITKPYDPNELIKLIEQALRLNRGSAADSSEDAAWREGIITRSPLMEELLGRAYRVAPGDASILIQGDSGTGKELLAQALHRASRRAEGPFVAINCGAIPEPLLESELFGHKKGAFTGATGDHRGLFLEADGGTLFLDEIGDMPLNLQVKLLRVLEMREVRPVGSTKTTSVDVRIISATHRDLTQARSEGVFREDLFYRLNVVTLRIPTLAERREDVPLLATHFLKHIGEQYNSQIVAFSPEAMELMLTAPWPGNVRQLYNVVEQAVALTQTEIVPAKCVEQAMQVQVSSVDSFEEARRRFERDYLSRLLKLTEGNVSHAARLAKRNRTEFYKLLQRHSLEPARFKTSVN
jgi:two-component system response regulator GlrR